jgi:site-specific DNA recombinase
MSYIKAIDVLPETLIHEIHYNFIGTLDTLEVACLPQSVTVDTRKGVAVEYITRKAG